MMLKFSDDEAKVIAQLSIKGGWDDPGATPIKHKIKQHFSGNAPVVCCYCRLHMHGAHKITIDIEHVLPKSLYPQFTFEPKNLNLSCKRCNMGIKLNKVSFYVGAAGEEGNFLASQYDFIHPNLDVPEQHLRLAVLQWNGELLVKYRIVDKSPKGEATYNFFELRSLEINTFDNAQGSPPVPISPSLPMDLAETLSGILRKL